MSGHNGMPTSSATSTPAKAIAKKTSGGGNKKGTSAERRATHNAVERARRESLNVRFLELAANLPSTCTVRRPSKSLIVNKSLEFVEQALNAESILRLKVEELLRENQKVIEELNNLRQERGLSPRVSTIEASLPSPLAESDFKKQSHRANLALSRGSFSLGGDFDDDYSGQASNSSLSSGGSPPNAFQSSSDFTSVGYQSSPHLSTDVSGQYFMNPSTSFHENSQSQHGGALPLPNDFYPHASTHQHRPHHQHQNQAPTSDYLPPITPTTATMFTQMMGAFSSDGINDVGQQQNSHLQTTNPLGLDVNSQSTFAALASNTFFDQRYSNNASASTPTSSHFSTTA